MPHSGSSLLHNRDPVSHLHSHLHILLRRLYQIIVEPHARNRTRRKHANQRRAAVREPSDLGAFLYGLSWFLGPADTAYEHGCSSIACIKVVRFAVYSEGQWEMDLPPMATSATGICSLPGPRLAWRSMTDRLFLVNTLRSGRWSRIRTGYRRTLSARLAFVDCLWVHRYGESASVYLRNII